MMISTRTKFGVAVLFVFSLTTLALTSGCNESATGTTQQAKSVPEDDRPAVAKTTSTPSVLDDKKFQVPDGAPDAMLSFINGLTDPEPFQSDAEAKAYQSKAAVAIGEAADRVLAGEATASQFDEALQWKLESLRVNDALAGISQSNAPDDFLQQQLQHDRIDIKRAAERVRLDRTLKKWKSQTDAEHLAAVQTYVDALKLNGITIDDARLLSGLSELFSKQIFATSDIAAAPFQEVVALLKSSDDPDMNELVPEFEATVRRLELPGKKLALEGKMLDGTTLDWNAYRGKVVLVDFWATDCEECLLETPNLARHLRMYRDKGFEIVGVNLNWNEAEVKQTAKDSGITWPTLFQTHSDDERWSHPIADNLAINGLPQLILVDGEGTVVHMNARGPELGEQLRKMLGEPAAPGDDYSQAGVPDGTPTEIMTFLEDSLRAMPQPRNTQEQIQNREKFRILLGAAIEKILAGKPTAEQAGQVIQMKITALRLADLGQQEGERQLSEFLDRLANHEYRPVVAAAAEVQLLRAVEDWDIVAPEQRAAAVDRYVEVVKDLGSPLKQLAVVDKLATMSGLTGDEKLAAKAVGGLLPLFADRSSSQMAKAAEILKGTLRRLNLPGNELELAGTFMDGTKLDWDSYRGKVVLVDFWASWCGPCRAEIPNVKKNLEAFGSKGFAVIGVCVDDDRAAAEAYIKEAGVTWPSLMGTSPIEMGFEHPVAAKYGLTGIPLAILVDREGKVVSLLARGTRLEDKLRELLGDPDEK